MLLRYCSLLLVFAVTSPLAAQLNVDTKPDDAKKLKKQAGLVAPDQTGKKEAPPGKKQPAGTSPKKGETAAPTQETGNKDKSDSQKKGGADAENDGDRSFWSDFLSAGIMGLMLEGGPFMWPILIVGVVAAGVIIERYRSLSMLNTDTDNVRQEVQGLLQHDEIEAAIERCDNEQGPVPAILGTGLRKYLLLRRLDYDAGRIEEQVVKAMEDYNIHVVAALERHLPVLATISSVAPMLGFLGTVSGMITSFKDIIARIAEANIVVVAAAGISEALLTTCFGLIVGIPAFIGYNYFTSVINRYVLDVEESATELIEGVTMQLALNESAVETAEVVP